MKHFRVILIAAALVLYGGVTSGFAQRGPVGGHGGGANMGDEHMRGGGKGSRTVGKEQTSTPGAVVKEQTPTPGAKNAAAHLLANNTKLSSRLQGLLPAGTNLQDAAQGFEHLGQFVAAVHVSHNLGIPFDQLKAKTVGPSAVSLGQAIRELKPNVNAREEAVKANEQAVEDMEKSRS